MQDRRFGWWAISENIIHYRVRWISMNTTCVSDFSAEKQPLVCALTRRSWGRSYWTRKLETRKEDKRHQVVPRSGQKTKPCTRCVVAAEAVCFFYKPNKKEREFIALCLCQALSSNWLRDVSSAGLFTPRVVHGKGTRSCCSDVIAFIEFFKENSTRSQLASSSIVYMDVRIASSRVEPSG